LAGVLFCEKLIDRYNDRREFNMTEQYTDETTLACDLTALDAKQRERYRQVREQLHRSIQDIREVSHGYTFRHSAEVSVLLLLAEFISLESRCCPFLEFTLDVESKHGPAWLTLTGPAGVKEFLRAEMDIDGYLL
jgi:hypothetical protein